MEREHLHTERNEKVSRYHDVLSMVFWLVLYSTSSESSLEMVASKLYIPFNDSWIVPLSTGTSLKVAEIDQRAGELKSQVAMKNFKRVTAVAVAVSSKRESDALKIRNA